MTEITLTGRELYAVVFEADGGSNNLILVSKEEALAYDTRDGWVSVYRIVMEKTK